MNSTRQIPGQLLWEVGFSKEKNTLPKEWFPAIVPGAVQVDYAKANNWPPFYYAENWKEYLWMEDVYWTYTTSFNKPELEEDEQLFFVSKGIDYEFEIWLNGEKLFYQEGMFTKVNLNLSNHLKESNELQVRIYPAPKIPGFDMNRSQAAQSCKPAVSYGWDWHPRLVPLGIWDDTFLEIRNECFITDFFTDYKLNNDFSEVGVSLLLEGENLKGKRFEWQLKSSNGKTVLTEKGKISSNNILKTSLKNPELWWPHDHGSQPLYSSEIKILGSNAILDEAQQTVGFRRVKLVMNEGLWRENIPFPKTRNKPPFTLEINGRRIFGKGTNWVNPEIFPGKITKERYNELLDYALEANFNLLRIWGGGIVNKESFYELCNEKGILVWTEFPLACNNYEDSPDYLETLEQESESIIKRIRKHPSNVMWSGGNELFNSWSGMTDQSLALRLLNSQCFHLDPLIPFIPTSPIYGVGHGNYVFRSLDGKTEVYEWMAKAKSTAYTEFGMPGPASVEILKTIIPENELFPPVPGTSWESHHAFQAWVGDTWLMKDFLCDYFGEAENLEELVEWGQWIQCEGYKAIYEEARRQKPHCAMAVNWCYNEPWPTAANNSILNYPAKPKPAFYAVSNSCRPVLASARIKKFRWKKGENFETQLYILNDKYEEIQEGRAKISVKCGDRQIEVFTWNFEKIESNTNFEGPAIEFEIPEFDTQKMTLVLEVEGKPEWNSEYDLMY
ncbi:MAG: glycoside hydrolase family 2 TIM barrel-domain containing protein, partial [Draconibacterium sp.]|nr:glycoside hydrolase family 2 TIM barrel-domain containing protein [Draconibacterium sp.]